MRLFFLASIALLGSCVGAQHRAPQMSAPDTAVETQAIRDAYNEALLDAIRPSLDKVSNQLVAIDPSQEKVRVLTWTKRSYYTDDDGTPLYQDGDTFDLHGVTWLTVVPYMQDFCSTYEGQDLVLRIAQNLGMPPCVGSGVPPQPGMPQCNDIFLELEIDPTCLLRPCPDPEIDDTICTVLAPGYDPDGTQPPPFCNLLSVGTVGCGSPGNLHQWMCQHWTASYTAPELYQQYPWTALGYTYDWGSENHVGQSEFVAFGKTLVTYKAMYGVDEYCGR